MPSSGEALVGHVVYVSSNNCATAAMSSSPCTGSGAGGLHWRPLTAPVPVCPEHGSARFGLAGVLPAETAHP